MFPSYVCGLVHEFVSVERTTFACAGVGRGGSLQDLEPREGICAIGAETRVARGEDPTDHDRFGSIGTSIIG